jgi:hypothetical protein
VREVLEVERHPLVLMDQILCFLLLHLLVVVVAVGKALEEVEKVVVLVEVLET